jgi:hypothetical protein
MRAVFSIFQKMIRLFHLILPTQHRMF